MLKCIHWFELVSQVNDVANGPLGFFLCTIFRRAETACCTRTWRYAFFAELVIKTFFSAWNFATKYLWPSSSSRRSLNILANKKFNRNSILRFQLIEISPYFLSTLHICENGWRGIEVYITRTFFWQFLHWLVNK